MELTYLSVCTIRTYKHVGNSIGTDRGKAL